MTIMFVEENLDPLLPFIPNGDAVFSPGTTKSSHHHRKKDVC